MLKMVILDDEKMERTYMKKYIDWSALGIEIVGEAANGTDGLSLCRNLKPDIIMSDIKMPVMDGLEFSRRVKEILTEVKIIFVSGYGDFDYARSAVDLNAFGYILKPFRIENVIEVVKKVVAKCHEDDRKNAEREQLRKILEENKGVLKESLIRELLDGIDISEDIWKRIEFLDMRLSQGVFCVLLIEIDELAEILESLEQEDRQILSLKLKDCISKSINLDCHGEVIRISEKQFTALVSYNSTGKYDELRNKVYSLAEFIKNKVCEEMNISVTVGVSRISDNIRDIYYLYEQAKDALRYKLFNLKGQIICMDHIQLTYEKRELDLKKVDMELVEYLRMGSSEKIIKLLDEVYDTVLLDKSISSNYIQSACISIICSAMRYLNEVNCTLSDVVGNENAIWGKLINFETIADVKQWMKNIFNAIIEAVDLKKKSKNRMIVDRIIEIASQRYGYELTTKELSKEIFLSPNYIGAIFKEEMGIGFLEYLTKVRMEKAAELLKDPNIKIYEIAQMVGYNNTPYFSTVFRDYLGTTPSEYREKLL